MGTGTSALLVIVSKTVRLELFHRVKFVTSPNKLNWGQPIQRWIYKKVNFSGDKSFKDFWAKHCHCVRLTLNKKRGNVATEVKSSFMRMMKEFDIAEEARPTLEDMLTMGENENNAYYNAFCDYILPAVCGRKSNEAKFNEHYISKIGTEHFRDLQKLVKQYRTTCDHMEFEILHLVKRQTASEKKKCIRFRDNEHCSIENDLLEDLDDDAVVGVYIS
eukprot:scaffold16129_cov71-Attheya_sp.AAC.2